MKIIKGHKFYTFNEVFKKDLKSKAFRSALAEDLTQMRIKRQIKEVRLKKKLTQKELAKKTDMPQSVIARLESGKQGLSFSTISRIATALGKKIELV